MASASAHNLPGRNLPPEILFRIVDFISISRILSFRSVCRSFQNHIDTHVMYTYLQRIKLVTHLASSPAGLIYNHTPYQPPINELQASFSHVENTTDANAQLGTSHTAKWAGSHAIFKFDAGWIDKVRNETHPTDGYRILHGLHCRLLRPCYSIEPDGFGWVLQLDDKIHYLQIDIRLQRSQFDLDLSKGQIRVEWKTMLRKFLREELVRERRRQAPRSLYTFCEREDCVRTLYRE